MDQFVAQVKALLEKTGYALAIGVVTLVTVIAAAWVAIPARRQSAVLSAESETLQRVITSAGLWVTQFEPASNEESAVWQNTAADLQALGVNASERLTLAQAVARRTDEAGYESTHIKFIPADPATPTPARSVAGVTFNPAQYRLQVAGVGSFSPLSTLIGTLPPAVELQSVRLARDNSARVSTSITLSVFEPAGSNGK
jgi:hypothetical protein